MVASIFSTQQPAFRFANITYEAEATALFARMTPEPDASRKYYINQLIKSLKDANVWSSIDVLYVMAAHSAQAARLNWKSTSYNLTAVNSPTFTTDRGYAGDGSTSYLRTSYNPSLGGVGFTRDNGHIGVWPSSELATTNRYDVGINRAAINSRSGSNVAQMNVNGSAETTAAFDSTSIGHTVVVRNGASSGLYRKNGSAYGGTFTTASQAIPNAEFLLGGYNASTTGTITPSGLTSRRQSATHIGAALNATQISDLYSALRTYLSAVGSP